MRRRTRTTLVALVLGAATVGSATTLSACGGRPDEGNPGNPAGDTTTTLPGTEVTG